MHGLQLQAGSILDCVKAFLIESGVAAVDRIESLLKSLSCFDIDISEGPANYGDPHGIYKVAENIVSRGLPTRPSWSVENYLNEKLVASGYNVRPKQGSAKTGALAYELEADRSFAELLWRSLHIVEPNARIKRPSVQIGSSLPVYGSKEERDFFENGLAACLPPYLLQLIESERGIQSFALGLDTPSAYVKGHISDFAHQRVDFSLEFPYPQNGVRGFVFEVDGGQHDEGRNRRLDARRDAFLAEALFKVCRIPAGKVNDPAEYLAPILEEVLQSSDYCERAALNYSIPCGESGLAALACETALIPFGCSRIMRTVLHLINDKKLDTSAAIWKILCLERDLACAELAFRDLEELLGALAVLAGLESVPKIELTIVKLDGAADEAGLDNCGDGKYDLIIDHALLSRNLDRPLDLSLDSKVQCIIRSAKSITTTRTFLSSENIDYLPLGSLEERDGEEEFVENGVRLAPMRKLLRDIFRKSDFRPGQLQILDYTLQNRNVIGLLPTGSGKSLVYQLAALLQPGVCIVVDPLKSLMRDQHRGLVQNGIDAAVYINSSLTLAEKEAAMDGLVNGRYRFAFISPERFQIEAFRGEMLKASSSDGVSFSYCVIDEAHCVSEWGHEFRTSYLCVGENARKFCRSWGRKEIPVLALTATASYDVLADIQRELGIEGSDSVVTLTAEEMARKELNYHVVGVRSGIDARSGRNGIWDAKKAVGDQKAGTLIGILQEAVTSKSPTLVFCPHKTGAFGVSEFESQVRATDYDSEWTTGTYMGNTAEGQREQEDREKANQVSQDGFIAGDIDILFATKAFGMGIDKPDIRNVFHVNIPSSIEGYYQEAGRAGRDREESNCTILYCAEEFPSCDDATVDARLLRDFHDNNFRGIEFEKKQLFELLSEIRFPRRNPILVEAETAIMRYDVIEGCALWPLSGQEKKRLYINESFGYFDLLLPGRPYVRGDESLSAEAIEAASEILMAYPYEAFGDLEEHVEPGIEALLAECEVGDRLTVAIPFENDVAKIIVDELSACGLSCSEKDIYSQATYCKKAADFLEKLERKRTGKGRISREAADRIKVLFPKIRNRDSTMKAIYRLFAIGIVYDYTIDYAAKEINCYIEKRSEEGYVEGLRAYLAKYFAAERVDEELSTIPERKGATIIQKCLNLLIEFTYDEIAAQRRSSIDAMEEACRYGLENPDDDSFEEYIMMYMSSRYARRQYLPHDTENGNREDLAIVYKYTRLVRADNGGEINNLKHLRGASILLHAQRPDNYVFLLLKAFTTLILEKGRERFVSQAIDEAVQGFNRYRQIENRDHDGFLSDIDSFISEVAGFDEEAAIPAMQLKMLAVHQKHLDWLKQYSEEKPYADRAF